MNLHPTSLLLLTLTIPSAFLGAEGCPLQDAGLRVGVDAENNIDLFSYEIFGKTEPSWNWQLTESLKADIAFTAALGLLSGEGEDAGYVYAAPVLGLSYGDLPVSLYLSTGPSVLTEDTFDHFDMGGNLLLISSIGFGWQIDEAWGIEYSFQHRSNAGLYDQNPGLEMHALSLSRRF